MEISKIAENIIDRFSKERYYDDGHDFCILYVKSDNKANLMRMIIVEELTKFVENLNTDAIEYKNKCEIYEVLISNSNFKMATEKINNRKKKEVEKDE